MGGNVNRIINTKIKFNYCFIILLNQHMFIDLCNDHIAGESHKINFFIFQNEAF
jgi:hypothetical protein